MDFRKGICAACDGLAQADPKRGGTEAFGCIPFSGENGKFPQNTPLAM
jgi:hypothetical protein